MKEEDYNNIMQSIHEQKGYCYERFNEYPDNITMHPTTLRNIIGYHECMMYMPLQETKIMGIPVVESAFVRENTAVCNISIYQIIN